MAAAGKVTNYKLAVSGTASAQVFTGVEPKEIKLMTDIAGVHIILTAASKVTAATVSDFLLPNGQVTPFEVGRGLDRISAITAGATGNVYIAVLE